MIPALAVVWASEPRFLKLIRAVSDAVFTITPRLAFRCGHAARVRKNTKSTSSRRLRSHSSSGMSSSQLKYAMAALLKRTSIRPKVRTARSTSAWQAADRLLRIVDSEAAANDEGALPREGQGSFPPHAAAGPGDDANFPGKFVGHG